MITDRIERKRAELAQRIDGMQSQLDCLNAQLELLEELAEDLEEPSSSPPRSPATRSTRSKPSKPVQTRSKRSKPKKTGKDPDAWKRDLLMLVQPLLRAAKGELIFPRQIAQMLTDNGHTASNTSVGQALKFAREQELPWLDFQRCGPKKRLAYRIADPR